ncbi:MAG TPA: DUF4349 domain-containing protein [Solirubrobacteraceae bacterium]|nr:DUF4349 domain-containing protein [Solirubrobacteraceae bacterium]
MRPFDEIPFPEGDYSDVALMLASVREWPSEELARELDARVARRFGPEATPVRRGSRVRLPRWAAGPAVAVVAGAVAAVVVLTGGGGGGSGLATGSAGGRLSTVAAPLHQLGASQVSHGVAQGIERTALPSRSSSTAAATNAPSTFAGAGIAGSAAPVAPGARQIQSAQISLTTSNEHVNEVAQEVFGVVGQEHGTVLSSHITAATSESGGGYASFSLSVPTSNLQATMTDLSRLHDASVQSRTDASQNVSHQYAADQRHLADAKALRVSLLKQLQVAYTQSAIDSVKAQLQLAERQIAQWQSTLGALQHQIGYSDVSVQVNQNGLPILPVARHHSGGFTLGRAGHDALRVLVVSAGVALIALAVLVPVGLVAALLMWLWVWLRQRRREHALDAAS